MKILNKEYPILFFNNANESSFKLKCDIFLLPEKCRTLRGSAGIFGKQVLVCTNALTFSVYLGYDLSTCENIILCLNDRENIVRKWNIFSYHFNGDWNKMIEFMLKFNSFDFDNPNSNPVIDGKANGVPNKFNNKPDEAGIDNLIEMAIAAGDISNEVLNVLVRKAIEKLGVDKDEAEIIVSGKISLKLKSKSDNHTSNQIQSGNEEYFVAVNGQQTGPFNLQQLQQLVGNGELQRNTFVWKQGMQNWDEAGKLLDLQNLFGRA